MFQFLAESPISPITNAPPDLAWLSPFILTIGSVIVALIGGVSLVIRRRQDKRDKIDETVAAAQPKVTDGWEEVRKARAEATLYYNLYRSFENIFYTTFSALRHLARTVRDSHPDQVFDKDIVEALAVVPPDTTELNK